METFRLVSVAIFQKIYVVSFHVSLICDYLQIWIVFYFGCDMSDSANPVSIRIVAEYNPISENTNFIERLR